MNHQNFPYFRKTDTVKRKLTVGFKNNLANISFEYDSISVARLSGNDNILDKSIEGKGQWAQGNWFNYKMQFLNIDSAKAKILNQN